jgi:long-chain acyl-CoA synthetase
MTTDSLATSPASTRGPDPWHGYPVPAMRCEAVHGDRVVRCFTDRPASLLAMFAQAAAAAPGQEAMVFEGRRWTYADLDDSAVRLAASLAAQGLQAGDRVVMLLSNRPEFLQVLLALLRLGAIAVPVGVREQRPGLAFIAGQCGARAMVFDASLADRVPLPDEAPALTLRLSAESLPGLPAGEPVAPHQASENDTAAILYTSGTTGRPKGAMLTHRNLVHSALHWQACFRLQPGERSALAVPASHVTGLVAVIAAMWRMAGCVVVVPEFKADAFVALLAAERISLTVMVPAMYKLCLMSPALAGADLSAWRIGAYGGAAMPVSTIDELQQRLPTLQALNSYGATETTSPTTLMPAGGTRDHIDSVGAVVPAGDVRVMDDDGREVPPGETGELWIAGPMVVPGYWGNPQATAEAFTAGYWHSGDLGAVDAQGFVRVFDRKKDMLNRGGFKIYSVEVENTLMAWPGVVEAAVVGKPCPVLGERVHAFVHAPGAAPSAADLRAHCASQLADYKVPETITFSATPLPRNANGKLMKRLLREQLPA